MTTTQTTAPAAEMIAESAAFLSRRLEDVLRSMSEEARRAEQEVESIRANQIAPAYQSAETSTLRESASAALTSADHHVCLFRVVRCLSERPGLAETLASVICQHDANLFATV
jgi:excinuclease UvrABC nuclease subunit